MAKENTEMDPFRTGKEVELKARGVEGFMRLWLWLRLRGLKLEDGSTVGER